MKVHLLTAARDWGGLETHACGLAAALEARGHDVTIVELGRDAFTRRSAARGVSTRILQVPLDEAGTPNVPLQNVPWWKWCGILARLRADVCVFTKGGLEVGTWALEAAARMFNGRYITIEQLACPMPPLDRQRHAGGLLPGLGLWWFATILRRRLRAPWAHAVVCVSEGVRRPLARYYGFSRRKLVTVHNGIDVTAFTPDVSVRRATRKAWGIPDNALVFGAVGRLDAVKGYVTAVKLFPRLLSTASAKGRDVRLVLVGDGPERPKLEHLIREAGVEAQVVVPGFSDRPQDAYPAIDVFLMPSRNEGLPLALAEAMACGCCPIATDVGGVREVIVTPELGWLVPGEDSDAFFNAMIEALTMSDEALRAMGARARQCVLAHFDAKAQLSAIVDLIEDGAARSGGRR